MITTNYDRTAHLRATFREAWGYTRHELLYIAWALMEVMLLTPIALAFMPWASAWPVVQVTFWLFLLILVPFNLARMMTFLHFTLEQQRRVMLLGTFLAIFIAIRTLLYDTTSLFDLSWFVTFFRNVTESNNGLWQRDVMVFILVGFTWWRGMTLVTREPDVIRLGLRLRTGALIFAPFAILMSAISDLGWQVVSFLLLYFAAALTAVALTRAEQIEREQRALVTSMTPRWMTIVTVTSLLVVAIAGFAAFFIKDFRPSEIGWLVLLWVPLSQGGSAVLFTIFYLINPLLNVLEAFLQWLVAFWNAAYLFLFETAPPVEESDFRPAQDPEMLKQLTQPAREAVVNWRVVLLIVLVLLVITAVYLMGRLYQRNRLRLADRDSFADSQGGRVEHIRPDEQLGWGQRLLQRLGLLRNLRMAASIRRIYGQMCAAAAVRGFPRSDAQTPYEYLRTLHDVWPNNQTDARLITHAFVRIRYGEFPETDEELAQIQQAWSRLERMTPDGASG
ncbi:MAG: DUF4129 domain-containing protein [Ardenticatenaceae bacterium]|nr:DUF4129 domain-containing protein [Anaerolineales bacterium]MCB8920694.1 DUF4129 domain-containing protein [Ardenticatenaceae bacterium]MCB8989654.1 DUF4129 domain-containing protein [Ardenticatenaceae bacterium]MCB9002888.1 DUF4129 domain-containing protein [Ardenticatenaceae bacterium]